MSDSDNLVPPSSSRQPRPLRDALPLDDGLPGVIDPDALPGPESVERPPASRKLTSGRSTQLDLDVDDISRWEIDGVTDEQPTTIDDSFAPDILRRTLPEAERVVLVSSTRAQRPATFGELLDAALELGA